VTGFAEARGRRAVAASILAVTLAGAYFAASGGDLGALPGIFLVNAAVLVLCFWFPAVRTRAPRDVLRAWRTLLPWLLGWTLVWDLASAGIMGERDLFQEWWLVYPSGVLFFAALLLLHGYIVRRWSRPGSPREP
jgi:hypothetical protein